MKQSMGNIIFRKLQEAKENLGLQEKLFNSKNIKEEVVIGQEYSEDNSEYENRPDQLEYMIPDPESPNDLDADAEGCVAIDDINPMVDKETQQFAEMQMDITKPEMISCTSLSEVTSPTYSDVSIAEKLESMDRMEEMEKKLEDDSGSMPGHIDYFLEKYAEGNDAIQILRKDLMSILSDIQWIIESNNQNEQFALDFADALNEASLKI